MLLSFGDIGTAIPRDAEIDQAQVGLGVSGESGSPTVAVYPLTTNFAASTATWQKASSSTSWTTAGGDFTGTEGDYPQAITGTDPGTAGSAQHTWFVNPAIVTGWLTSGKQPGFLLKTNTETASPTATFYGSSSATPPSLNVWWQYRPGIRPDQTYVTHPVDDHENLSVNVADGDLVDINTEYSASSPGVPLGIYRTYNSSQAANPFQNGYGWFDAPGESGENWGNYYGPQAPGSAEPTTDGTVFNDEGLSPDARWYPWHPSTYTSAQTPFTQHTPPAGTEATETFDGSNNPVYTDNRSGIRDTDTPGAGLQVSQITDRDGNTEVENHSTDVFPGISDYYPTTVTATNGRVWTYAHQSGGYVTGITPPAGGAVSYTYSGGSTYTGNAGQGNLTSAVNSGGGTTTYTYDPSSREVTSILSPGGRKVTFAWRTDGRLASMTYVSNLQSGAGSTTTFAYTLPASTGANGTTVVSDPDGHTTTYTWTPLDEVTKTVDGLSRARSASYNQDGQPLTLTDNSSDTEKLTYDAYNNGLTDTAANQAGGGAGRSSSTAFQVGSQSGGTSIPGYQYLPSSSTDTQGKVTSYTYGTTGDLASSTPPSGSGGTPITYKRQADPISGGGTVTCGGKPGQVCTSITGRGMPTSYAYDSHGQLTTITPPAPLGVVTRMYDSFGRLRSSNVNNSTTSYTYDNQDRLTQLQTVPTCTSSDISAGNCITYSYDGDGNLTGRGDQTGSATLGYDFAGYQTSTTIPDLTGTSSVGYDAAHNITSYTDPGGTVAYGYDNANDVT